MVITEGILVSSNSDLKWGRSVRRDAGDGQYRAGSSIAMQEEIEVVLEAWVAGGDAVNGFDDRFPVCQESCSGEGDGDAVGLFILELLSLSGFYPRNSLIIKKVEARGVEPLS